MIEARHPEFIETGIVTVLVEPRLMPSPYFAARTIVRVSPDAFLTMAFAAAEAAMAAPDFKSESYRRLAAWEKARGTRPIRHAPLPPSLLFSETGIEVGGLLWGSVERSKSETVISVERAMTTTGIASDNEIAQSPMSALLLADLAKAVGHPWGMVVGDFHSHPLLAVSPREIAARQLFGPSETDLEGPSPPHCDMSLIMSVTWAKRLKQNTVGRPGSVFQRIDDFAFCLTGYSRTPDQPVADTALEIGVAA